MLWLKFLICAAVILIAGSRLSIYADTISERTGFSASVMGVIVLAFITSCPELVTSLKSITASINAPDLAAGDLLGANMYNMLTLALLAILFGKGSLLGGLGRGSKLTSAFVIAMLAIVLGAVLLYNAGAVPLGILNISFASMLLAGIYIAGTITIYRHETAKGSEKKEEKIAAALLVKSVFSAAILVLAGIWLAHLGKAIADHYKLGEMYVGVLFLALATTLPECVVSFTALKRGAVSMAAGNLLGSNFFNISIIAILDIVMRKGEFFAYVSNLNIIPAATALLLTIAGFMAMAQKLPAAKRVRRISWDSAVIIVLFLIGHVLMFNLAK